MIYILLHNIRKELKFKHDFKLTKELIKNEKFNVYMLSFLTYFSIDCIKQEQGFLNKNLCSMQLKLIQHNYHY